MDILLEILPFSVGLIVSPLSVVALIIMLVSGRATLKSAVFVLFWLITPFLLVLLVLELVLLIDKPQLGGVTPAWQHGLKLFIGLVLLVAALLTRVRIYNQKHLKKVQTPDWLKLDKLNLIEIALLSIVLFIINPVNLAMVVVAGVSLANIGVTLQQSVAPVAIFAVVGGLSVLLPYFAELIAGKKAHYLLRSTGQWLSLYGDHFSFWVAFAYGVIFLFDGFQGLAK